MTESTPEPRDVEPIRPHMASPWEGVAGGSVDVPRSVSEHVEELMTLLNDPEWLPYEKRQRIRARLREIDARGVGLVMGWPATT